MMLRMFIYLYDLEIIDDEVFLKWKEDINEQYPGKGKALFEVQLVYYTRGRYMFYMMSWQC